MFNSRYVHLTVISGLLILSLRLPAETGIPEPEGIFYHVDQMAKKLSYDEQKMSKNQKILKGIYNYINNVVSQYKRRGSELLEEFDVGHDKYTDFTQKEVPVLKLHYIYNSFYKDVKSWPKSSPTKENCEKVRHNTQYLDGLGREKGDHSAPAQVVLDIIDAVCGELIKSSFHTEPKSEASPQRPQVSPKKTEL